jgi:hypothetical protein
MGLLCLFLDRKRQFQRSRCLLKQDVKRYPKYIVWKPVPCHLVEMCRHFIINFCLHPRGKTGSGQGSVTGRYDNSNESSFSMKSGIIDQLSDY